MFKNTHLTRGRLTYHSKNCITPGSASAEKQQQIEHIL